MTKVVQVLGVQDSAKFKFFDDVVPRPTDAVRLNDSPKSFAYRRYLNPALRTDGEFGLALLADRIAIKKAHFGDAEGLYTEMENLIYSVSQHGLHDFTNFTGSVSKAASGVVSEIKKLSRLKKLASPVLLKQRPISRVGMFDPFGNDPVIDITDKCNDLRSQLAQVAANLGNTTDPIAIQQLQPLFDSLTQQLFECDGDAQIVDLYNQHLEKSGHDFTYAYITQSELNQYGTFEVKLKASRHRGAIEKLSSFTNTISESNLKTWIENGVMRENTRAGEQPFSAKETAFAVPLQRYRQLNGINNVGGIITTSVVIALISLAAKIVSLVAESIKNKDSLADKFQPEQLAKLALDSFSTGEFDVNNLDWETALNGANSALDALFGGSSNNGGGNTPPIGGGGTDDSPSDNNNLIIGGGIILTALALLR